MILERHVGSLENGFQVAGLKQLVTTSLENVFDLFEDANVVDGTRGICMIKRLFNAQTFPHMGTVFWTRVILNDFLLHGSPNADTDGVSIEVKCLRIVLEEIDEQFAQKLRVLGSERRRKFVVQRKASNITVWVKHSRKFLLETRKDGR